MGIMRRTRDLAPPAVTPSAFLRPGWLLLHVFLLGSAVGMVFLGLWQLRVSEHNDYSLQNVSYVFQWWIFSGFAVAFWIRLIRDARRPPASAPSTGGEIVLGGSGGGRQGVAITGPANLLTVDSTGSAPIAYRGYVLPDSSRTMHRSYGDDYHNAYNDYLWEWALVDEADGALAPSQRPDQRPTDAQRGHPSGLDAADPRGLDAADPRGLDPAG